MKIILLIMIGISILNADFTKSGDTVIDSISKLEWQDDAVGSYTSWQGAIDRCEALVLDGKSDWRLPNINELKSIVDRSKYDPAINSAFTHTSFNYYWSSSTHKSYADYAWGVYFSSGDVSNGRKDYGYYVRCVRGGQ